MDSVVTKTVPQATPWIVYTCGPMGAGKGHALQWMSDNGFFPLGNIVHIDPDHFKSVMSEWRGYTERDTGSAGSMCHQESGYIQELAQEVAMQKSQNIWVDGSLRNGDWHGARFPTEIYTRGCHWFPRLLAWSKHACDQWHSSRKFTLLPVDTANCVATLKVYQCV